jgi:hypothetical protein
VFSPFGIIEFEKIGKGVGVGKNGKDHKPCLKRGLFG